MNRLFVTVQLSRDEEANALPILLRHSPGRILPNRVYVIGEDAAKMLSNAGIRFTKLSREAVAPKLAWCEGNIFL